VSDELRIRLATEEDLGRDFGPGGFTIGIRVRPKDDEALQDEERHGDEA
jgi:hypothetical protein